MSWATELRRRQVFRTAAWYGGLAWLAVVRDVDPADPTDSRDAPDVAIALALLGRHDDAIRVADLAVSAVPEARDFVNGPEVALKRAWVLIHSGRRAEEGCAELARLLDAYGVHARYVAREPSWLILREVPCVARNLAASIGKR